MASAPPWARIQMCSTSFRSIVALPTLSVRAARAPLADRLNTSALPSPLARAGVYARLALDRVVVVAEVPVEEVIARAQQGKVVAIAAVDVVVAAGAADQSVGANAAEELQRQLAGGELAAVDGVVAGPAEDVEDVRLVGMKNADLGGQPADDDLGADGCDLDVVVITVAVDVDLVELLVARCAARSARKVDDDRGHIRAD